MSIKRSQDADAITIVRFVKVIFTITFSFSFQYFEIFVTSSHLLKRMAMKESMPTADENVSSMIKRDQTKPRRSKGRMKVSL